MLTPEITEFLREMKLGTHAILIYGTPENKHDVLFSHLGFGANEGLAYICSEENPEQIREGMRRFGIDVDGLKEKSRLAIRNYDEFYIVNGRVDTARIMDQWSDLAWKCTVTGLKGLRAAGETSCFFRQGKVRELTRYEYALHRKLELSIEAICAYSIVEMNNSGHLEMVMPMLRAHDPVILAGPKVSLVLEPDKVEDKAVEMIMQVRI